MWPFALKSLDDHDLYIYTINIKDLGSSSMLLITYANNGKLCDVTAITYHS